MKEFNNNNWKNKIKEVKSEGWKKFVDNSKGWGKPRQESKLT